MNVLKTYPKIFFTALFLLVSIGVIGYFLLSQYQVRRANMVAQDIRTDLYKKQSVNPILLEKALSDMQDPTNRSYAELDLAYSYSLSGNLPKAIAVWKSISTNQQYSAKVRGDATYHMLATFFSVKNNDIERVGEQLVFTGPVWSGFIKNISQTGYTDSGYPIKYYIAERNALEWAKSLDPVRPSMHVVYKLSLSYVLGIPYVTGQVREQYIAKAQNNLELGNTAYAEALSINSIAKKQTNSVNTTPPYVEAILSVALQQKARAQAELYMEKVAGITVDDIIATYTQAITYFEYTAQATGAQQTVSAAVPLSSTIAATQRYELAVFLAKVDSVKNKDKILTMLAPLYTQTTSKNDFLETLKTNREEDSVRSPARKNYLLLSKIDPNFKVLLLQYGWKEADFK